MNTCWPWPAPVDDGGAAHLREGTPLPDIALRATSGGEVNLARLAEPSVVFLYTWTGRPGLANPPDWDTIPGAHGSTPEAEGFRDLHDDYARLGRRIIGLSVQDRAHQQELAERLKLPFPLLSDHELLLCRSLRLPTFTTGGTTYLKRLTMLVRHARIEQVIYPVHPPDAHAKQVLAILAARNNAHNS